MQEYGGLSSVQHSHLVASQVTRRLSCRTFAFHPHSSKLKGTHERIPEICLSCHSLRKYVFHCLPPRFLEIGTFGDPKANIRFATGMAGSSEHCSTCSLGAWAIAPEDIDLPVFSLNVTGELKIVKDDISEKRPWTQKRRSLKWYGSILPHLVTQCDSR